jgi:hypothetical protein
MWKHVPKAFRSFYFIAGLTFLIWMIFLDPNDLISRYRLSSKLHSLESERAYYLDKIKEVEKDRDELLGNKELLEKFAREKYLMKKESEDVFVVIEK